ncbi:CBF/Mak21 family-domain-containing protein [Phyllosticta citriasiana]|uniref:CBF/Mak21 family-domain-containing protein n=1 Tax=Phyllosticta citriasiana TaxID=595635 RepID=A0ABR1KRG1_9PEZI
MTMASPDPLAGNKRKREGEKAARKTKKSKSKSKPTTTTIANGDDLESRILELEAQITESRRHYNNIVELITIAKGIDAKRDAEDDTPNLAMVALCRVFCRLLATGSMKKSKGLPESELMIVQWLRQRYQEFTDYLLSRLNCNDALESLSLQLAMRLVKEEVRGQTGHGDDAWKQGLFQRIVREALSGKDSTTMDEFREKFADEYTDVRFYTLHAIASVLKEPPSPAEQEVLVQNSLEFLLSISGTPGEESFLDDFYGPEPEQPKHALKSLSAHKRLGQDAWLAVLRSGLSVEQRKRVLGNMTNSVTPWFLKVELLMDFLTDSYNVGGGTSLLALSGLFHLMREKNLDYPSFYQKLYSLLDDGLLNSKYRSRFFRLLDEFMSSTHLPAALVASFIKRLSRLALHAPPAGIVVVVPWIYNMLKRHPACTFMIHREIRDPQVRDELEDMGMDDPFNMEEQDPMETNAIESSLWEIETLQSHYHPNVATLAEIISEQFTKQSYNLEDFLDHSYNGLIEAELGKDLKKTPVVEYEIPKRIFTAEEGGLAPLGSLMLQVMEAGA